MIHPSLVTLRLHEIFILFLFFYFLFFFSIDDSFAGYFISPF